MTSDEKRARVRALLESIRTEAEASRSDTSKGARLALERIRALSLVGLALVQVSP